MPGGAQSGVLAWIFSQAHPPPTRPHELAGQGRDRERDPFSSVRPRRLGQPLGWGVLTSIDADKP
jgi:hypothetical protein